MKKVSILVGVIALIGISGVIFVKSQKNNANTTEPAISNVQNNGNGSAQINGNNSNRPLNNQSQIIVNSPLPSPEGTNKLPQIVRPQYNPQTNMTPPPEVKLMVECQGSGNPEARRKCFEAKIQSNVTAQTNLVRLPDGTILNVAEYTQKINSGQIQQIENMPQQPAPTPVKSIHSGALK